MSENLPSNDIQNDKFNHNAQKNDYVNLFIRLKQIKSNIALLGKTIFK